MKRSKHSLSHYKLLTCDMGELVPVGCVEVLPGDTFQHRTSALIRVSPMVAPVMHPVQVRIHHWFVPNRLIWNEWEEFITGGTSFTYPTVTVPASHEGGLLDYLGVAPVQNEVVSALPVRGYNLIYNEFYRDQDLVSEVSEDTLTVQKCAWEKDYFTAARPWPQKGSAVTIPLGDTAPVVSDGTAVTGHTAGDATVRNLVAFVQNAENRTALNGYGGAAASNVQWDNSGLEADLSGATGADIRDVRLAFALQRYQEARARYGSRYTEYLRYCGIRPSDARLQRPEYLGGGKQTIAFSEVLQTAPDAGSAVGDLYGHGISALRSRRYRRFFEEHGHVISLMSVRPKSMYSNAVNRQWLRREMEDYYQKELAHIGQQAIERREVYAEAGSGGDTVFGYADRYREYREHPSTVSGEFRSSLNFWHLARDFGAAPALNQSFVECTPSKRIHAVQTNDVLWCMVNHSLQARRLVPRGAGARVI